MQIGKLDERITLQELTEVNEYGSLTQDYSTVATVWGRVVSRKGTEAFEAGRVNAEEQIRVQIRYRSDVNVKWRVQIDGQDYNIVYLDRSARREGYMWLHCECLGAE